MIKVERTCHGQENIKTVCSQVYYQMFYPQKIESTGTEKVHLRISTCSMYSSTKVRKDFKNIK